MDTTKNPLTVTAIAGDARAFSDKLRYELRSAGKTGARLADALEGLAKAMEGVIAAQGQAVVVTGDNTRNASWKVQQATRIVGGAFTAAEQARAEFASALKAAQTAAANDLLPRKPALDALAGFTATELAQVLGRQEPGRGVSSTAITLLQNAITAGDDTTAWLLAGPDSPLRLTLQRLSVHMPAYDQEAANVLAQARGEVDGAADGVAGLQAYVRAGGNGTLDGLATKALYTLKHGRADYEAWLQTGARTGIFTGIYDTGPSSTGQ